MDCPTGSGLVSGIKRGVVWGTAVVLGALNGILQLDDTLSKDQDRLIDDSRGVWSPTDSDPGKVELAGEIPMYGRYRGIDLLLGLAFGATAGAPTLLDTLAYKQIFTPAADTAGQFATYAKLIGPYVKEYTSCKFNGFNFKAETGAPATLTFPIVGDNEVNDSVVNTPGTMASITIQEDGKRILFAQGVFRMNDRDDVALDAGDVITPVGIELVFDPKRAGTYDRATDKNLITEPCPNGKPEYRLILRFAKSSTNSRFIDFKDDQPLKLDIKFTGEEIELGETYQFNYEIPFAKISKIEAPTVEGIISETVEFVLHAIDAAPDGMTATDPIQLEVHNTESADVLA